MLFNSFDFFIFFIVLIFAFSQTKRKKELLLISSYIFYMFWNPYLVSLIVLSACVDFYNAKMIYRSSSNLRKKVYLLMSLLFNLGMLSYFKYANFLGESFSLLIGKEWSALDIILPVGISFYTFQTMSYTIDVYKQKITPQKNFIDFNLYVCYFPQLIAGPIERSKDFLFKLRFFDFFPTHLLLINM